MHPRGPFSLEAAAGFGFGPDEGQARPFADGVLTYAFPVDGGAGFAGVELRQPAADGAVEAVVHGDGDPAAVERQVARVLSLDHDGDEFLRVGERDPVIGQLQAAYPGHRPVLFYSPYEAAAWAVVSARQRGIPAADVWRSLGEEFGEPFELAGRRELAFPQPGRLVAAPTLAVPGLNEQKQERLRAVAEAAEEGFLDVGRLQSLGPEGAMDAVQELKGIGPFSATLIVVRATGFSDAMVAAPEPKLLRSAARFYGLDEPPTLAELTAMAEAWRPFRTWTTVLLRIAGSR